MSIIFKLNKKRSNFTNRKKKKKKIVTYERKKTSKSYLQTDRHTILLLVRSLTVISKQSQSAETCESK